MKTPTAIAARQSGLSLIELMVGLTVGLVISAGLMTLVAGTSRAFRLQDDFARLEDGGTAAIRYLADDFRMAGFYGLAVQPDIASVAFPALAAGGIGPGSIAGDCVVGTPSPPWSLQIDQPITIVAGLTPDNVTSALPCIQKEDFSPLNTAVIIVRGALGHQIGDDNNNGSVADELAAQANFQNTLYVQSAPGSAPNTAVFLGARFAALKAAGNSRFLPNGNDAPIFEYQTHIYYIRPCSRPTPPATSCSAAQDDDGGHSVPTLVRHEIVATASGPALKRVPLVEGVEAVELLYGVDPTAGAGPGRGIAQRFSAAPADWSQVVSARISVLMRTANIAPGHADDHKDYDLGSRTFNCVTQGLPCNVKRHVFAQLASWRNIVQRRALPAPVTPS